MRFIPILFVAGLALTLGACDAPAARFDTASTQAASKSGAQDNGKHEGKVMGSAMREEGNTLVQEQPPSVPTILYLLYGQDGDGAHAYEIANHMRVSVWGHHALRIGGRQFYTAFAQDTPAKYGNPPQPEDPAEGVMLSAATFELVRPGTEKPWKFVGGELALGLYGSYGREIRVDPTRLKVEHKVDEKRLLLAIPTVQTSLAGDSDDFEMSLFSFDLPDDNADHKHAWRYLGSVLTGVDNSRLCKTNPKADCTKWSGTFEIVPAPDEMPALRVVKKGTTIDDATGSIRAVDASDTSLYVYDQEEKRYRYK
ncbi:hypothetical protein [Thermomonas fusca]|uniref:Lipoprotein n=1 Tax=Thermomonas fusca TaxID=215690 RepID=A0A5R9PBD6_9GAMM|nr:hypothetical protein [Thermomonas fusca]TLX20854.1 hypothetical protein E5S66_12770 [Thermomonas fusca]